MIKNITDLRYYHESDRLWPVIKVQKCHYEKEFLVS